MPLKQRNQTKLNRNLLPGVLTRLFLKKKDSISLINGRKKETLFR